MRDDQRSWRRAVAVCAVIVAAGACGDDGVADGGPADGGEPAEDGEIATDVGVTEEPCENGVNADNGCIYLGILSDLTVGPFAPLGVQVVEGQRAFWQRVNEEGGIGGYDIDIDTYTRDNEYDPQTQAQLYNEIEPEILALAQTLGTPTTEEILAEMDADDVVGIPTSWWSGWNFDDSDHGLILESGYSYCIESQIGLDWSAENEGEITSVQVVGYPGDYGGDTAAGAEAWAAANGAEYVGSVETGPNALVGSQDGAVQQVLSGGADVVVLGVGPAEAAEIVGGAAADGFQGRFLGSVPTWNPALMDSPAAPALEAMYTHVGPWEAFTGSSPAHRAMRAALGEGELPGNDGYTFGWISSYPMRALLETAADNGDLTRQGLRGAVEGLVVDYEGALPERTFGSDGEDVRTAVISKPDPDAPLRLRTASTDVTGPTADEYAYDSRCSGA